MVERIHDDEPDTSQAVVRTLLRAQCAQWSDAPIEYLRTSGTDNAMWRIHIAARSGGTGSDDSRSGDDSFSRLGPDLVVRLPRRPAAAAGVEQEVAVLQAIEGLSLGAQVRTPIVRHIGQPHGAFPYPWSVLQWVAGADAWSSRQDLTADRLQGLAQDLGAAVKSIGQIKGVEVRRRSSGNRGGPLGPLLDQLDQWLARPEWNAGSLIDVAAIRRLAAQGREVIDEPVVEGFLHGDLIPGNLLVDQGRLTAIIDWGGAGFGDIAQDLAPAWSVLTAADRPAFREIVGADDAAWIRGRMFELEHAVGGVLYYRPKRHLLGDVMARTLDRILAGD